jgi:hypothetical protein
LSVVSARDSRDSVLSKDINNFDGGRARFFRYKGIFAVDSHIHLYQRRYGQVIPANVFRQTIVIDDIVS